MATSVMNDAFALMYADYVLPFLVQLAAEDQLSWPAPNMLEVVKDYLQAKRDVLTCTGRWDSRVAPFLEATKT